MNRVTVPLLAALDALIAALIGLGVCVVPIFVLWSAQYGMGGGAGVVTSAAADVWLLGHGVDLTVTLPATLTAQLGLPAHLGAFPVTIAAAGFSLATFLFGARIGTRSAQAGARVLATAAAGVVTLLVGAGVTWAAGDGAVAASAWQGILLPALVMVAGVGAGIALEGVSAARSPASAGAGASAAAGRTDAAGRAGGAGRTDATGRADAAERAGGGRAASIREAGATSDPAPGANPTATITAPLDLRGFGGARSAGPAGRIPAFYRGLDARLRGGIAAALRGGTAAAMLLIAAAALLLTVALAVHFGRVIGLYESLQAGILGGAVLTVAQAALLPNAVVWTAAWLTGPGFSLGTGSSISPMGTEVGPVPALPLFGALPHGGMLFGFVWLLVPLAAGVAAGLLLRIRTRIPAGAERSPLWIAATAAGTGVVAGVITAVLVWWTSGAAGPGRLEHVGADPVLVGAAAALEIAVGAAIGLVVLRSSAHR